MHKVIAALAAALALTGCSAAPTPAPTVTVAGPTVTTTVTVTASPAQATTYTAAKSDWTVELKTAKKQCFGSAGCNVTFTADPIFARPSSELPATGTISIAWHVEGASEPYQDTFRVSAGRYSSVEEVISAKDGAVLKAVIDSVDYRA